MTPTSPAPSSAGAAAPALRVGDPRATVRQGLVDAELFAGCADRTLERLVAASTLVRLPPGGILCHAGDAMHDLFVIIEGTVSASRTLPDGRRQVGGVLGPGQCCGLPSSIDHQPAMLELAARDEVLVVSVPRAAWTHAEATDPVVRRNALVTLCSRCRTLYASAAVAALLPLRDRVLRTLAQFRRLSHPQGAEHDPVRLVIAQDELADMLGVTRQSVNRVLRGLEDEGLLKLGRGAIELPDPARLSRAPER